MSPASRLRALLDAPGILTMPCCFDGLSARLVARAGFPVTFMSGFSVAAARFGLPDTGLVGYAEMAAAGTEICAVSPIPVIGDGDTGHGNAINVKRTVRGFARAGFAAVMIEDQVAPKRCGHTPGKAVVDRRTAKTRVRAAIDARDEGADILILARTDARAGHGLDEAIARARAFAGMGADITFVEAPRDVAEMRRICAEVPGPALANMLEGGATPILTPGELEAIGFKIAAYPLTLLSSALKAMEQALDALKSGAPPPGLSDWAHLRDAVGFNAYDAEAARYTDAE